LEAVVGVYDKIKGSRWSSQPSERSSWEPAMDKKNLVLIKVT